MTARTLRFSMRGDGGHIHVVRAVIKPRTVTMTCSCDGDRRTMMCPHRQSLLDGETHLLVGRNVDDIQILVDAAVATGLMRWNEIARRYDASARLVRDHLCEVSTLRQTAWPAQNRLMPRPPLLLTHNHEWQHSPQ